MKLNQNDLLRLAALVFFGMAAFAWFVFRALWLIASGSSAR